MLTAPRQLDELVVDAAAEQNRVTVFEVVRQLAELDDFRRADEGEVLRIEVDDLPLARERLLGDFLEGGLAVIFVVVESRLRSGDGECFDFIANGLHAVTPVFVERTNFNQNHRIVITLA